MNTGRLAALRHYRGPRAAILLKTSLIENRRGQRAKWAWHHFPPRLIVSTVQCIENNSFLDPRVPQNASQSIYISKNFLEGAYPQTPYIEPLTQQNLALTPGRPGGLGSRIGKLGLCPTLEPLFFKFLNPPLTILCF